MPCSRAHPCSGRPLFTVLRVHCPSCITWEHEAARKCLTRCLTLWPQLFFFFLSVLARSIETFTSHTHSHTHLCHCHFHCITISQPLSSHFSVSPHKFVNTPPPPPPPALTQQSTSSIHSHWLPVTSLVQSVESDSKLALPLTADAPLWPHIRTAAGLHKSKTNTPLWFLFKDQSSAASNTV